MHFIDLATQQKKIAPLIEENIRTVLAQGKYIMGPEVLQLEEKLGAYVGVKHAIGCSSGTDALLLALMAYGVGPGDAIFTSPFTFIATAEVITLLGATPVFVDIDVSTFNIAPEKLERAVAAVLKQEASIYPLPRGPQVASSILQPKGVISVDLFGLPAPYAEIREIIKRHGLFLVEDAAQSFGAEYHGKKACGLADIGCTSFFPAKPLGGYGDGGMCFTDDDRLASILRSLRLHGKGQHKYDNTRIGINGRLDTIQAAILLAKFEIFPREIDLRQEVAHRYGELLASQPRLATPQVTEEFRSAWAQYSILASDNKHRAALQTRLKESGIPTAIYYPNPLHLQTAFAHLAYKEGDFPVSEECSSRILSLPMHPYLGATEQKGIADILQAI